jgi:hypothetical protein
MRVVGSRMPPACSAAMEGGLSEATAPAASAPADTYELANDARDPAVAGTQQGTFRHGVHLTDLVLDIVPGATAGTLPAFEQFASFVGTFLQQIEAKEIALLNEKFDGSPAILLGFDKDGRPYVAYKHGVERKGGQRLMRTLAEVRAIYREGSPLRTVFEDCLLALRSVMKRVDAKDLVFQADLLFTERNAVRDVSEKAVRFRPNPSGIVYALPAGSPHAAAAAAAKVGLVVHTAYRRVIDPTTGEIVGLAPVDDPALVEAFAAALRSEEVFAIDPYRRSVAIDRKKKRTLSAEERSRILEVLERMRADLASLGADFRLAWKPFLPHFAIFLNAMLKPGADGGIYRAAAAGEPLDAKAVIEAFSAWIAARCEQLVVNRAGDKSWRTPRRTREAFETFLAAHREGLARYLAAYYGANRIQYLLKPHMAEAYASKLGGGRIEGMMLADPATGVKVKLVDRLDFTMQNFAGERERWLRRRAQAAVRAQDDVPQGARTIAKPFRAWHAGAVFYLCKVQPVHVGHIEIVLAALASLGLSKVYVVPSAKGPNLSAESWQGLGLAATRTALRARQFTYAFSRALREEILRQGLPAGTKIAFAETSAFMGYLKGAEEEGRRGKVALLMGEKELVAGRYDELLKRYPDHLRAMPMAMQAGGLSATRVRAAIESLHERGDKASYDFLCEAYAFLPPKVRKGIIGRLLWEWGLAVAAAERVA